ncbi:fimbrial protein [Parabacteroides johnsonii]|nr:fimbrial protein [Parabacteroides johnsonii]
MKLRNLFLASLAVCTMASCSKDDDGISGPQEVDAYLSFASTTDVMTKASIDGGTDAGTDKEAKIQSLTAYVFDESGKYVISKHVSLPDGTTESSGEDFDAKDGSITTIKAIHVKVAKPTGSATISATKFQVLLLANMNELAPADLDALKNEKTAAITTFNEIGKSYLPMHSDVLTVTGLTPVKEETDGTKTHHLNWYKDNSSCVVSDTPTGGTHVTTVPDEVGKVTMTRSISRVQFTSLKSNFTAQYAGVTFEIDSIYLANVRNNATVMGEENTEADYFRGGPVEFAVIQGLIDPEATVDASFAKRYETPLVLPNKSGELNATALGFDKYINANQPEYAERGYLTRLLITGTLMDGDRELGKKYFHIPLKLVDDAGNVASNRFFKISATITGEGSPNPDEILENACINFSIEVAPWNVVEQTEEDTN